jgi:hypothetical protein
VIDIVKLSNQDNVLPRSVTTVSYFISHALSTNEGISFHDNGLGM